MSDLKLAKHPILVTGTVRSGTTWLGKVMATCQNTFYIHEPFNPDSLWNAAFPTPLSHYYLCNDNGGIHRRLFNRILRLDPSFKGRWKDDVREHKLKYIENHTRKFDHSKPYIPIVKDPTALYSTEWLFESFNVIPVILLRHPVSIVKSLLKLGWAQNLQGFLIWGQPLMLRRLCEIDTGFERYADRATWMTDEPLERALNFVGFNCRFIAAMKSIYPDWTYIGYEQLTNDPLLITNLMHRIGLEPTARTNRAIFDEPDRFDSSLAHQKSLTPHPVNLDEIYSDEGRGIDWRTLYAREFGFLADSFPDMPYLATPEQ